MRNSLILVTFSLLHLLNNYPLVHSYPPNDMETACQAMVDAGGFFVPWAAPPPPPPPPGPPITPAILAGKYTMDSTMVIDLTAGPTAPNGSFEISFGGCKSCCWSQANGTATPNRNGGGTIHAIAHGDTCDTNRVCVGTVVTTTTSDDIPHIGPGYTHDSPDSPPTNDNTNAAAAGLNVSIAWACTCHAPPVPCGAMGESPWVKQ
jgi:hypothetical protein